MTRPDADELRIRGRLRKLVDGPTAEPPPMPPGPPPDGYEPAPATDTDAWWDELYTDEQPAPTTRRSSPRLPDWWKSKTTITAEAEAEVDDPESSTGPDDTDDDTAPGPTPVTKKPAGSARDKPRRTRPTYRTSRPDAPRMSLLDAWDRIPNRIRWLAYHATAAAAGWRLGWVDWGTDTAAWYADGHWVTPSAFALYVLGVVVLGLYRRSRGWAWPVAWAAAVPVSSVIAGIALYGTGYQP